MKRFPVRMVAVAAVLLCGIVVLGDTLESVQKAIVEKAGGCQSQQGKSSITQDIQNPQMKYESQSESTYECLKKGDKWLYRVESKTKTASKVGDQEQKQDSNVLMVCDGEFVWTLSELDGQKSVMKSRPSAQFALLTDKTYFDNLQKDYELKLLPDETVDGKATWPIQATSKQPATEGMLATLVTYFDKDSGVGLKTVGKDSGGKVVMTSITKDVKLNPSINAERFVFKAPEGVPVVDTTQNQPGQPEAGKAEAGKTEEPKKEENKEKKEEQPKKSGPKIPKLPG